MQCWTTLQETYQMTANSTTDNLFTTLTKKVTETSTNNVPMLSSKSLSLRHCAHRPYRMPNQEIWMYAEVLNKAGSREQQSTRVRVNMTRYCDVYMSDIYQWFTAPYVIGIHSTTLKWWPASHIWELMAVTMPEAESQINVQSQDYTHWIINYFSGITVTSSNNGLYQESTVLQMTQMPNWILFHIREVNITVLIQHYTTKPQLQLTMNGMQISQWNNELSIRGRLQYLLTKLYWQVDAHWKAVYQDLQWNVDREIYQFS